MHFSSLLVRVNIEAEFSILFILANKIDDYLRHVHKVQCLQITNPCEYLVKRLQIDPISYDHFLKAKRILAPSMVCFY